MTSSQEKYNAWERDPAWQARDNMIEKALTGGVIYHLEFDQINERLLLLVEKAERRYRLVVEFEPGEGTINLGRINLFRLHEHVLDDVDLCIDELVLYTHLEQYSECECSWIPFLAMFDIKRVIFDDITREVPKP